MGKQGLYAAQFGSLFAVICLLLLAIPSASLCASWEPIGPSGGYFLGSVTNPQDASQVTVITNGPANVYRSMDDGVSWSRIGEIPVSYYVLNDMSAFDFSVLYAVTSSRCYRSTDGGVSWSFSAFPSSSGSAYRLCVDPADSSKVYAAGIKYDPLSRKYSMAFFKSTNGGRSWTAGEFFPFDYFYPSDMTISKSDPSVLYIAGYKEAFVVPYYYLYGALYKSSDSGESWTDISESVESESDHIFYSVAIDPADVDKVYVGGYSYDGSYHYQLYQTVRTGRGRTVSWARTDMQICTTSIGIDPFEPAKVYAAGFEVVDAAGVLAYSVATSTDYGQSWAVHENCLKNPGTHIEVAPAAPSTVYVSTYTGLFKSSDSGNNWESAHEGIHAITIPALAVAPSRPATVLVEYSGCGIMGSYNSGDGWDYLGYFLGCGNVCDILINPLNENEVLTLEGPG